MEEDNSYPLVPFEADDVDPAAYRALRAACLQHAFLPTFSHGMLLDVGMVAPGDEAAVTAIRHLTHQEVRRFGISEADFDRALSRLEARESAIPAPPAADAGEIPRRPTDWGFFQKGPRDIAGDMVRFAFAAGASDLLLDEQEDWMDVAIKLGGRKEILPPVEKSHAASLLKIFKEIAGLSTHTRQHLAIRGRELSGWERTPRGPAD